MYADVSVNLYQFLWAARGILVDNAHAQFHPPPRIIAEKTNNNFAHICP